MKLAMTWLALYSVVVLALVACDDTFEHIPAGERGPIVQIAGGLYRYHDPEKRVTCYTYSGVYCFKDEELDDAVRVRLPTRQ